MFDCPHEMQLYRTDDTVGQWYPCTLSGDHEIHSTAFNFRWRTGETGQYRVTPPGVVDLRDPAIRLLNFQDVVREKVKL